MYHRNCNCIILCKSHLLLLCEVYALVGSSVCWWHHSRWFKGYRCLYLSSLYSLCNVLVWNGVSHSLAMGRSGPPSSGGFLLFDLGWGWGRGLRGVGLEYAHVLVFVSFSFIFTGFVSCGFCIFKLADSGPCIAFFQWCLFLQQWVCGWMLITKTANIKPCKTWCMCASVCL